MIHTARKLRNAGGRKIVTNINAPWTAHVRQQLPRCLRPQLATSPIAPTNRSPILSSPSQGTLGGYGGVTDRKGGCVCVEGQRWLHLHEYQSKDLLRKNNLNVQKGKMAGTVEAAYEVAKQLKAEGAEDLILKCQVLAGGRGKGHLSSGLQGGVKVCKTPDEVRDYAKQMIGYRLVTHQTTAEGEIVKQVLIHEGVDIKRELYLAIVMDRQLHGPAVVASQMGGVDIEEVAKTNPEAVHVYPIDMSSGIPPSLSSNICTALGFTTTDSGAGKELHNQLTRLYDLFVKSDCTQLEINPLAVIENKGGGGEGICCVDAKVQFDDNAIYRQRELFDMEDKDLVDEREEAANKAGLNFVAMDGNIGCLVNGAGLAMATMDIIKLYGGTPANFLDVGGGSDTPAIVEAFKILQSDPKVTALFVNIFGGIMRCDIIASGLVEAAKAVSLHMPLVVRLRGNNVDIGKGILESSGINCKVVEDFDEAAKTVCQLAV
eukprot:GHVQ01033213.1.p1 GENE.GHVQ01033213.1~~GHVQ01033213.1.p1  ORF type:complete len:488 (-),score=102.32 GHVQ01033213.1:552-2015(-)